MTLDSVDTDAYQFGAVEFAGVEMSDIPVLPQIRARKNALQKIQGSYLEITMARPNFGLTRGMQVSVFIVADTDSARAARGEGEADDFLEKHADPIPDSYHSGVYYINGMTFEYSKVKDSLLQKLYCVKISASLTPGDIVKDSGGNNILSSGALSLPTTSRDIGGELQD